MSLRHSFLVLILVVVFPAHRSFAESEWLKKIGDMADSRLNAAKDVSLSDTRIGAGLKEALKVGIENAVKLTGRTDGYFANELIKIGMPPKLQLMEKPLRMAGFSKQIDDFILSMNRAAENAAPAARQIFLDAIFNVTIADAQALYSGGPSAATDFLKAKTYKKLRGQFAPIVTKSLSQHNVTKKYQDIIQYYQQMPMSQKFPAPSIEDYVVGKSLDGLFKVLALEEAKIRKDPAARTTELLKDIFK